MNDIADIFLVQIVFSVATIVLIAAWFYLQNKGFEYNSKKKSENAYISLLRAARFRSLVIVLLLIILAGSAIILQQKVRQLENTNVNSSQYLESVDIEVISQNKDITKVADKVVLAEAASAKENNKLIAEEYRERQLDAIKQKFEDAFVSYFYLLKCEVAKKEDYSVIVLQLKKESSSLSPLNSFLSGIYDAAKGSYLALYSSSPCDEKTLAPVKDKYLTFIESIKNQ